MTGLVVAGLTLLGRWVVRLLAAPAYFEAHEALPWVALGWAMYGLYLVFVTIGGRAGVTSRNFPAALAGVVVNVVVLVALVGPLGIAGAGIALVRRLRGHARRPAPADAARCSPCRSNGAGWRTRSSLLAGISVAGELLLPTAGLEGFALRSLALAAIPLAFLATGFMRPDERAGLRNLARRRRAEDGE